MTALPVVAVGLLPHGASRISRLIGDPGDVGDTEDDLEALLEEEAWPMLDFDLVTEVDVPDVPGLRLVGGTPTPAKAWSAKFAQALVEVMAGERGVHQLLRCTSRRAYQRLEERLSALDSVAAPHQRRRRVRPRVRSIHCFQPEPGIAEVSVHIRDGDRSRALAARIEHRGGKWLCVAVEFG